MREAICGCPTYGIAVFCAKSLLPLFGDRIALDIDVHSALIDDGAFNVHEPGDEVDIARSILQEALVDDPKRLDAGSGEKGFSLRALAHDRHQLRADQVGIVEGGLLCRLVDRYCSLCSARAQEIAWPSRSFLLR